MTISDIKTSLSAAVLLASQKAAKQWVARVQELLAVLKTEGFGGDAYVCSGMGRSFLSCDYSVRDDDPRFAKELYHYKDENDVLDYVEPGSRKCGKLQCTAKARRALTELWQACEFSMDEDFKVALPYKVWVTEIAN